MKSSDGSKSRGVNPERTPIYFPNYFLHKRSALTRPIQTPPEVIRWIREVMTNFSRSVTRTERILVVIRILRRVRQGRTLFHKTSLRDHQITGNAATFEFNPHHRVLLQDNLGGHADGHTKRVLHSLFDPSSGSF